MSKLAISALCFSIAMTASRFALGADAPAALNFTMKSLAGEDVNLAKYRGHVILMVNVASKCGLTPQYKPIEALYEKYSDQGFTVLGFPCNQFHEQEPGTAADIRKFCTDHYGVKFDMFGKVEVNGPDACPLYKYLTALKTQPVGPGKISWNFEKFLINRQGEVVARFGPKTRPESPEVVQAIEKALAEK